MSSLQVVLLEPARMILAQIGQFLVNALLVIIILIIGWVVSKVIKAIVTKSLKVIKLDQLSDRIQLNTLLEKGGITYTLSELIGVVFYWLALLVTFLVAVNAVDLTIVAALLSRVIGYIPNVIAAVSILIIGMFVATFLRNIVQTAANNAGLAQSKLFSKIVEVIVIAFSIFVGLEQLNIGIRITELTLSIILGSVGLGFALAFGLGCKDIAGRAINEFIEKLKKK